jgi:hypothetical protein
VAALPAVASEVASSARVAVSLLARVAESPLRGRVSIEALSGHVVASSFGRASAGLALASGVVSSSALASSAARGLGGGVVGHRRRHRRPGGGGDRRRHGAGDRAPGEATGAARRHFGRFASVCIRCANFSRCYRSGRGSRLDQRQTSPTQRTTLSVRARGALMQPANRVSVDSHRGRLTQQERTP